SHGCRAYQSLAFCSDQRGVWACEKAVSAMKNMQRQDIDFDFNSRLRLTNSTALHRDSILIVSRNFLRIRFSRPGTAWQIGPRLPHARRSGATVSIDTTFLEFLSAAAGTRIIPFRRIADGRKHGLSTERISLHLDSKALLQEPRY